MPESSVNVTSEAVMAKTIPFALGWGAVLTGVTVGVSFNRKKKEKAAQAKEDEEMESEVTK